VRCSFIQEYLYLSLSLTLGTRLCVFFHYPRLTRGVHLCAAQSYGPRNSIVRPKSSPRSYTHTRLAVVLQAYSAIVGDTIEVVTPTIFNDSSLEYWRWPYIAIAGLCSLHGTTHRHSTARRWVRRPQARSCHAAGLVSIELAHIGKDRARPNSSECVERVTSRMWQLQETLYTRMRINPAARADLYTHRKCNRKHTLYTYSQSFGLLLWPTFYLDGETRLFDNSSANSAHAIEFTQGLVWAATR